MALDISNINPIPLDINTGILAFLAGMIVLVVIISIGLYIYMSFAYMAIGKKAKLKSPGLAWIPGVGPAIIAFQTSKMHWWPWLLLIGFIIPFLNFIAILVFVVFAIIWQWKMLEAVKRPGWWVLLSLIPAVGTLIWLIMVGIAAWGEH